MPEPPARPDRTPPGPGGVPQWPDGDVLADRARTTPERSALVSADADRSWSYRALDARVDGLVRQLGEHVSPGDRVATLVDTRVAVADLVHAALRYGVALVPLNVRLTADEVGPQVARADPALVVCEADTEDLATAVADCPVASVDEPEGGDVSRLTVGRDETSEQSTVETVPLASDDTALVMFTSGTTGEPKGVRLTVGNLLASATASAFRLGVAPGDRWLVPLPTYHMGGLAPVVRSALYGTAVVLRESFEPGATARAFEDHDVTAVSLVPTALRRLLDAGWTPPDHLRFVLLGGAPTPQDLLERCEEVGVPVCPTYGLTETASQVATARPDEARAHPGTVGQPLACTTVTVVDDDGEPVPAGEPGELVVHGATVTPGYLDDARTETAFGERGLHTGDVGYRDADGRLWVVGRTDDRIVTGGENVHPGEVAAVLREHPGVRDVAVVGLPDDEWGERVAALVVPDGTAEGAVESGNDDGPSPDAGDGPSGATGPTADALREHCEGRLAGYKHPRTVAFADGLPRTASGTVERAAVRERLSGAEGSQ